MILEKGRRRFRCTVAPLMTLGLLGFLPWLMLDRLPPEHGLLIAGVASMIGVALIVASQLPRSIDVDAQGIHIHAWGESRFIGFGSVDHIREDKQFQEGRRSTDFITGARITRTAVIGMKTGPSIEVDPNDRRAFVDEARRQYGAWVDAREQREKVRIDPSLLEPAGRSASTWRAEVRALRADPWDYRQVGQGFDEEGLWLVVEDDNAPPGRRIGAALALGPVGEGRAHLRSAARRTPPPLQDTLLEIAEAEDEEEAVEAVAHWLSEHEAS